MKIVEFPENFDELTAEQLHDVFELHYLHVTGEITERDMKVELISRWLKLGFAFAYKLDYARKTKRSAQVEHLQAQIYRIAETMHWLYRVTDCEKRIGRKVRTVQVKTLAWDGIEPVYNEVSEGGYLFVAPDSFFKMSAAQYIAAGSACRKFLETNADDDLNRFFATVYLPERTGYAAEKLSASYNGRRQENFNPELTETYYSKVVEPIAKHVKYAAVTWFNNADKYLKTGTIEIEGNEVCFAPLFKGGEQQGQSIGLTGILLTIAEEGTFGNMDQVMERPIIDIFVKMFNNYLQLKNMRKK